MKKLILALATVAFIGIGGSAVSAQTTPNPTPVTNTSSPVPAFCAEADNPLRGPVDPQTGIPENCRDWYVQEAVVVLPPATTTTVPVTVPAGQLPRTGSGVSPILGIGALLLVGGGIVVVATRRRSTSTSPAT